MEVVSPRRRIQIVTPRPAPQPPSQRIASQATTIAAIGALVVSALGIIFTARSVDVAADSATANREQVNLLRQGQVADRFARAVDQLGSEEINVRFGAIYSLERLMRESAADRDTIVQVLSGFVRQKARKKDAAWPPLPKVPPKVPPLDTDIQAALTVLGRRADPDANGRLIDLSGANLQGADLIDLDFNGARFSSTSLFGARLGAGDFEEAMFDGADLAWVNGDHASFEHAGFQDARLSEARLPHAALTGVWLDNVDICRTSFSHADLRDASFEDVLHADTADFDRADLEGAIGLPPDAGLSNPLTGC